MGMCSGSSCKMRTNKSISMKKKLNIGRNCTNMKVPMSRSIYFVTFRIRKAEQTVSERKDIVRKLTAEIC